MATFVILYKFTEQGVRNIKDSPKRTEAAVKAAARAGMTIRETLWLGEGLGLLENWLGCTLPESQ